MIGIAAPRQTELQDFSGWFSDDVFDHILLYTYIVWINKFLWCDTRENVRAWSLPWLLLKLLRSWLLINSGPPKQLLHPAGPDLSADPIMPLTCWPPGMTHFCSKKSDSLEVLSDSYEQLRWVKQDKHIWWALIELPVGWLTWNLGWLIWAGCTVRSGWKRVSGRDLNAENWNHSEITGKAGILPLSFVLFHFIDFLCTWQRNMNIEHVLNWSNLFIFALLRLSQSYV